MWMSTAGRKIGRCRSGAADAEIWMQLFLDGGHARSLNDRWAHLN